MLAAIMLLAGMVRTNAKRGRHSTCTYHYFIEKLISQNKVCKMLATAEQWWASVGCNNAARWHGRDKGKERKDFEEQLMSYITFLLNYYRDFNSLDFQSKNSIMLMSYIMFLLDFYKDFNSLYFQGKNSIKLMFLLDCYRKFNSLNFIHVQFLIYGRYTKQDG